MRLKEKKILKKFAAILKKFSAQGAKKVDYGNLQKYDRYFLTLNMHLRFHGKQLCQFSFASLLNEGVPRTVLRATIKDKKNAPLGANSFL